MRGSGVRVTQAAPHSLPCRTVSRSGGTVAAKATRDPVAPARRSAKALTKVASCTLEDGTAVHSFQTLLQDLASTVRNTCPASRAAQKELTFEVVTATNAQHWPHYQIRCRIPTRQLILLPLPQIPAALGKPKPEAYQKDCFPTHQIARSRSLGSTQRYCSGMTR